MTNDDVDLAELSEANLEDSEIEGVTEDEDSQGDEDGSGLDEDEDLEQERTLRRGTSPRIHISMLTFRNG